MPKKIVTTDNLETLQEIFDERYQQKGESSSGGGSGGGGSQVYVHTINFNNNDDFNVTLYVFSFSGESYGEHLQDYDFVRNIESDSKRFKYYVYDQSYPDDPRIVTPFDLGFDPDYMVALTTVYGGDDWEISNTYVFTLGNYEDLTDVVCKLEDWDEPPIPEIAI